MERAASPSARSAQRREVVEAGGGDAQDERRLGGPLSGSMRQTSHMLHSWLADLAFADNVLDAVEDLYGADLLCWSSTLFVEEAHTASCVSWHQDSTDWGPSRPDVVLVWSPHPR